MNTIRRGSTGSDVGKWQAIIGVPVDNNFGPATEAATKEWQRNHKLVPDGVVGPATWSLALGDAGPITPSQPTPSQGTDGQAYAVVKGLRLTEPEKQYLLTVARGEGFYGLGWGNPGAKTIEDSKAFGLTGTEGKGSNNWGAVQGEGDAGSFYHVDYHANGQPYKGKFKRYGSGPKGAADMARILLKPNVKSALNKGDLKGAVYAQHSNGYFELDPAKYLAAVQKNYGILTTNIGWKPILTSGKSGIIGLATVGMLAVGYGIYKHFRG